MPTPARSFHAPRLACALGAALVLWACADEGASAAAGAEASADGNGSSAAAALDPAGLVIANPASPERPYFFDLGRVPYGEVLEREVRLVNREGRAVRVREVIPACGCTSVRGRIERADGSVAEDRLGPGGAGLTLAPEETLTLVVRTDTALVPQRNSPKLINVRVRNDASVEPFLTLEFTLTVVQPFEVVPRTLALGAVPENGPLEGSVQVVYFGDDGREVALRRAPEGFEVELEALPGLERPAWKLSVRRAPPQPRGPIRAEVELATGFLAEPDDTWSALPVPITGEVVGDFASTPTRLQFAPFPAGQRALAQVEVRALLAGLRFRVLDVLVLGEQSAELEARWQLLDPDSRERGTRLELALETRAGLPAGAFQGEVVVELDAAPALRIPYGGVASSP